MIYWIYFWGGGYSSRFEVNYHFFYITQCSLGQRRREIETFCFLVASPTSLGFFYMDRVFILIVHNFYLCFCSSLISLHSLRHISSQSICGTKPKRPILPTSATGGQVSPRCDGVATLSHWCFLHAASQIWTQNGAHGAAEKQIDHFTLQIISSFILCFLPF